MASSNLDQVYDMPSGYGENTNKKYVKIDSRQSNIEKIRQRKNKVCFDFTEQSDRINSSCYFRFTSYRAVKNSPKLQCIRLVHSKIAAAKDGAFLKKSAQRKWKLTTVRMYTTSVVTPTANTLLVKLKFCHFYGI